MQSSQGGMGAGSMQDMQRLQQQLAQAQYQRQQQASGGPGGSTAQLVGANNTMASQQFPAQFSSSMSQSQNTAGPMGNTALAMMQQQQQNQLQPNQQQNQLPPNQQQQQQQQQHQGAGSNMQGSGMASMFGSFGSVNQAMVQGNSSSTMEASTGSSTRLMAMAGMNVNPVGSTNMPGAAIRSGSGMDSSSNLQNMQATMQQQAQQAAFQKNQLQNQMGFGMQVQGQLNTQQQMLNQANGTGGSQNNFMMRSADGFSGNQMNSQQMMLQQQLANLQQQVQGQQPNNMAQNMALNSAQNMANRQGNQMVQGQNSSQNLLQQRQQQLLQQMQDQQRRTSGTINQQQMAQNGLNQQQQGQDMNNNMGMMQQMMQQQNGNMSLANNQLQQQQGGIALNNLQNQQQNASIPGSFACGPLTEQQLLIRQQNILRGSSEQQSMTSDPTQAAHAVQAIGGTTDLNSRSNMSTGNNIMGSDGNNSFVGAGMGSNVSGNSSQQQQRNVVRQPSAQMPDMNAALNDSSTHSHSTRSVMGGMAQQQSQNLLLSNSNRAAVGQQSQKSFLDGNFAGGWQSNADLPDRRKVIFSILEVIKQMRPNTNTTSTK